VLRGVFAGHDRVEAVFDPELLQDLQADMAVAAGDHRHRHPAPAAVDHLDHRVDRVHEIDLF